jgi:glyoxylase-like metal-dependent hydrolase (beta-lactamase superfamily II)
MGEAMREDSYEPRPSVTSFTLGPYATNCYVVAAGDEGECWIVDASFSPGAMIQWVREKGLRPSALVLTHAHVDHIAGASEVVRAFSGGGTRLPVWIHEAEAAWLGDPMLNLSAISEEGEVTAPGPDRLVRDGDQLKLGGTTWEVLHTPGHSPGGISLVHRASGTALVGDALFAGSVGRTDFPGSDGPTLVRSIRERLYRLPGETVIYPGHGPASTIERERRTNPFVRG